VVLQLDPVKTSSTLPRPCLQAGSFLLFQGSFVMHRMPPAPSNNSWCSSPVHLHPAAERRDDHCLRGAVWDSVRYSPVHHRFHCQPAVTGHHRGTGLPVHPEALGVAVQELAAPVVYPVRCVVWVSAVLVYPLVCCSAMLALLPGSSTEPPQSLRLWARVCLSGLAVAPVLSV
jgi:hypothetical protein